MSVRIEATYLGDLGCTARHAPSSDQLLTDAPKDNHGKGEHFSPTDLLATALGTCILTTMAIVANEKGIGFEGAGVTVDKEMGALPRRHVSLLTVRVRMPQGLDERARKILERVAETCPVAASLSENTRVATSFEYPDT